VRVRNGAFEGIDGIVTELRHRCRVVIALEAVRQCFSLEADLRDIDVLQETVTRAGLAARQRAPIAQPAIAG
jgi:hypothetical protein